MATRPLNSTAAALLGFLHEGPMTGWDLVATAHSRIGNFWSITRSQVYRELARLVEDGLAEVGPVGARDRKPHTITDAGRQEFARWIEHMPGSDSVRYPLLLTIAFANHLSPERLAEVIKAQRDLHVDRLSGYEKVYAESLGDTSFSSLRLATLDLGLRHERAMLDWLDDLPRLLELPVNR